MSDTEKDIQSIIDSARRMGVEFDEVETANWLRALEDTDADDLTIDTESGTFGHRVSMLDFSPRDLARFRRIGAIVEVKGPDNVAESALALSGSAAQSKIQSFPGDCDYFQRLNLKAPTREGATTLMARLLRDHVAQYLQSDNFKFLEAKLGSYPVDVVHNGDARPAGSPISWTPDDVTAGFIEFESEGVTVKYTWEEAAVDPGWVKLDWVVADPERRQLSNASNVIDVTWESPEGEIVSLDGYLDAYFQEVYLDADAMPTFAKVASFVSEDALDEYVERLEGEVKKYLSGDANYGKAAKRMYNIFRLSGRYLDAAFVRELFDEPTTVLYQVWSLISTLDNATEPGSSIQLADVRTQADELVMSVIEVLDGPEETEIVKALLRLTRVLGDPDAGEARESEIEAARNQVVNVVNTFFKTKLESLPSIRDYMLEMQDDAGK